MTKKTRYLAASFICTIVLAALAMLATPAGAFPGRIPHPMTDTSNRAVISLFSCGYISPYVHDREPYGRLDEQGWNDWKDQKASARIYFWPQQDGRIAVSLQLQPAAAASVLRVSLDNETTGTDIEVPAAGGDLVLPAGSFTIDKKGYHSILVRGIRRSGAFFPRLEGLVVTGEAAKDIRYNRSPYRGAPSTHLRYLVPGDSTVKWFYTEVTVPDEVSHSVNAYYETNGFGGGYAGIQLNGPSERRFIFSVWSNYNTDNPKEIPADYAVNLNGKGPKVFTGEFGNEGSGGHSHLVFPWRTGSTYRILNGIRAVAGDSTTYIAWYAAPDDNYAWHLMAEWTQHKSGARPGLTGLYAFVENFGPNGNDFFKAYYGNQWICTPAGHWMELTRVSFSTTAGPAKHQRYDYGAGVEGNRFYMFSGGFKRMNNIAPGDRLERTPNGLPPAIDFSSLPGL